MRDITTNVSRRPFAAEIYRRVSIRQNHLAKLERIIIPKHYEVYHVENCKIRLVILFLRRGNSTVNNLNRNSTFREKKNKNKACNED